MLEVVINSTKRIRVTARFDNFAYDVGYYNFSYNLLPLKQKLIAVSAGIAES